MNPYADTNFLVQAYLELPRKEHVFALLSTIDIAKQRRLPITWLLKLEFANALERSVFESRNGGPHRVAPEMASAAHAHFEVQLRNAVHVQEVVLPLMTVLERSRQMILRRSAKYGFRTYDILHVASALELGCDTMWSFDKQVLQLAKLEGLKTN
jgi:predicted nucleic acid-binding protein